MTAETYYNGKLLHTDYYMTQSQWEKQFHKNAKRNLKRNLKRYIKRKIRIIAKNAKSFFYAGMIICGLLVTSTILGIMADML